MRLVLAAAATLLSPAVGWAQIPLGPVFPLNAYTTNFQQEAAIAADAAGNFVVTWQSYTQDGSHYGVFGRRHLASGIPIGTAEFRVNGFTAGYQRSSSVAAEPGGRFVVTWQGVAQDGDGEGVFARRYDSAGTPGPEFRVNQQTTGDQRLPKVAMDAAGNFVVVWSSHAATVVDVFARRYDAAGVAQGAEFQVNTYTTGSQTYPTVAIDAAGNFVVAWASAQATPYTDDIFARRYDSAGLPLGDQFRVNTVTSGLQTSPSIAMNAAGAFVVAWNGNDRDQMGVFARRFDASGIPLGSDFRVNEYTTGQQIASASAAILDRAGNFLIAWHGPSGGPYDDIFARAYDASGAAVSDEFTVNTFTTGGQVRATVAGQPGGRFVVAWSTFAEDGDAYGIVARRFATDFLSRDGFESGDLSGWSSAATDGGDLSVSASAAMKFTVAGLQAVVDDTNGLFVEDALPDDEDRYRARFWVDTNGFDPGETQNHRRTRLFIVFEEAPNRRLVAIVLRRVSGAYALMARTRLDDGTQHDTGFFPIGDGPHSVELAWSRASSPDAEDGSLEFWIDGASVHQVATLDNRLSAVDFVRMGALSVKTGATGTLYFDEFESRRLSAIGP